MLLVFSNHITHFSCHYGWRILLITMNRTLTKENQLDRGILSDENYVLLNHPQVYITFVLTLRGFTSLANDVNQSHE